MILLLVRNFSLESQANFRLKYTTTHVLIESLIFHVFNVKNYIDAASLEYFYMMPFLMYYGNMWNNLD
jgi:hypothetical protein